MQRLRHPIRAIREPFGKAGLIVGVIALVFAMLGGAYAASNSLSGGKATASKAKAKKGPRGPRGPKGPAGPTGPAGTAGAKGDTGAAGSNGSNGAPGTPGASPVGTAFSGPKTVGSVTCNQGGIEYKGATTDLVCNGKKGEDGADGVDGATGPAGPDGQPWTAGGVLPVGKTETGTWGGTIHLSPGEEAEVVAEETEVGGFYPISFTIPLENAPTFVYVEGASAPGCPGLVNGIPTAEEGKLCVYQGLYNGATPPPVPFGTSPIAPGAVSRSGVMLRVVCTSTCVTMGPWAVTAAAN